MVGGYVYNPKTKQWDLPSPMYVTITKLEKTRVEMIFTIAPRIAQMELFRVTSHVIAVCDTQWDVKVENPSDEAEAANVSVQMWCKNSKKNYQNSNIYQDDFQSMLYSLPPLSEDTGKGIMMLPRDIAGAAKCDSPGVYIKSQMGVTKALKKEKYVATIYFPIEKLLILDPNVLG